MKHLPLGLWWSQLRRFEFFWKFAKIFAARGAPLSMTPATSWSPVSLPLGANLPPLSNDTGVNIFPEICIDSGDTDTDAAGKLQQVSTKPLGQHRQHKQIFYLKLQTLVKHLSINVNYYSIVSKQNVTKKFLSFATGGVLWAEKFKTNHGILKGPGEDDS
jgi:hypothetical protein